MRHLSVAAPSIIVTVMIKKIFFCLFFSRVVQWRSRSGIWWAAPWSSSSTSTPGPQTCSPSFTASSSAALKTERAKCEGRKVTSMNLATAHTCKHKEVSNMIKKNTQMHPDMYKNNKIISDVFRDETRFHCASIKKKKQWFQSLEDKIWWQLFSACVAVYIMCIMSPIWKSRGWCVGVLCLSAETALWRVRTVPCTKWEGILVSGSGCTASLTFACLSVHWTDEEGLT